LGRAFKIGGYTQTGGEGWQASVSLSAMVLTSFNHFADNLTALHGREDVSGHRSANRTRFEHNASGNNTVYLFAWMAL
jgi:hypothetical protein